MKSRILSESFSDTKRIAYIIEITKISSMTNDIKQIIKKILNNKYITMLNTSSKINVKKLGRIGSEATAKDYIRVTKAFNLIQINNNIINIKPKGELINIFSKINKGNIFNLNHKLKSLFYLFLQQIDYDIINILISSFKELEDYPYIPYKGIVKNLKSLFFKSLENFFLNNQNNMNTNTYWIFKNKIDKFHYEPQSSWINHLLIPRIHWLIDLDLLKIKKIKSQVYLNPQNILIFLNNQMLLHRFDTEFSDKIYESFFKYSNFLDPLPKKRNMNKIIIDSFNTLTNLSSTLMENVPVSLELLYILTLLKSQNYINMEQFIKKLIGYGYVILPDQLGQERYVVKFR